MNLGSAKTKALQRMDEYSSSGAVIPEAKNADFKLRMNDAADYVQKEISDKVGINAVYTINSSVTPTATENGYDKYDLPTTYKDHRFAYIDDERFEDYRMVDRQIWIPEGNTSTITLYHYKYPATITDSTADSYEFEVDPNTHECIPYYIAGQALMYDDPASSDKLLNIYYSRLEQLTKRSIRYPKKVRITTRW